MKQSNVASFVENEFPPHRFLPLAETIRQWAKLPLVVAEKLPPMAYIGKMAERVGGRSGRSQPAVTPLLSDFQTT